MLNTLFFIFNFIYTIQVFTRYSSFLHGVFLLLTMTKLIRESSFLLSKYVFTRVNRQIRGNLTQSLSVFCEIVIFYEAGGPCGSPKYFLISWRAFGPVMLLKRRYLLRSISFFMFPILEMYVSLCGDISFPWQKHTVRSRET